MQKNAWTLLSIRPKERGREMQKSGLKRGREMQKSGLKRGRKMQKSGLIGPCTGVDMNTLAEPQAFANLDDYHQVIHNAIDLTYHELMCTLEALLDKNERWVELGLPHADHDRLRKLRMAFDATRAEGFEGRWAAYRATRIRGTS
jgi:hypothetical protein